MQPFAQAVICVLFAIFFLSPSDEIVSMTPPQVAEHVPALEENNVVSVPDQLALELPSSSIVVASAPLIGPTNAETARPARMAKNSLQQIKRGSVPPEILLAPTTRVIKSDDLTIQTAEINTEFQVPQLAELSQTEEVVIASLALAEREQPQFLSDKKIAQLQQLHVPPEVLTLMIVTGDRVNVRRAPEISQKVILQLNTGDKVVGTSKRIGSWRQIILSGQTERVWVSAQFIQPVDTYDALPGPASR